MNKLSVLVFVLVLVLPLFSNATVPSQEYWDPFRGSVSQFRNEISNIIAGLLKQINQYTSQTVSAFIIPSWTQATSNREQYKKIGNYIPLINEALKKVSLKTNISPPPTIVGEKSQDNPCGGLSTDSYWADDCSCRCSRGGIANLDYEVSDRCPENDNLACEDCKKITRHNNEQTTIEQCRSSF
jgi:hypothetical protein